MEGMENGEELETLVRDFDRIYQGYNDALLEIQSLKMSYNCEVMKREALEATCNDFKAENEKLRRSHHESWSKFVDEMAYRAKCQRLTEEIREANFKLLSLGAEHEKMIDMLKQEHNQKIHELEKQVSCSLDKQASDQILINQFQQELVTHETHIEILTSNLEMVTSDLQSKYDSEILELKSQLLAEQNEKNDLQVKLQNTENELQIMKQKQEKQQRDSISLHHVETLKQKIMRLRKENESLKRQVAALNDDHT
ncbi:protein At-4/1 [Curcuma longa]|uniref:protein At-4/1 n=1 Tax=Curcuma longa TaxID=136217 RepID=UPI003D9EDD97